MAKRPRKISSTDTDKMSIPGIRISELLELEPQFPKLRFYITIIMLAVVIIAQIRVKLQNAKPNAIQRLESVNVLIKGVLAKSEALTYVTAATAIRQTLSTYSQDENDSRMLADHEDLSKNLSGPITSNRGPSSILGSPEKVRAYRRSLMAQTTGSIQSAAIHSPSKIARDIEDISPNSFMARLPFSTDDITMESVVTYVNQLICPGDSPLVVCDVPSPSIVKLETCLNIKREEISLPNVETTIPENAPAWKKAALNQIKNLMGDQ